MITATVVGNLGQDAEVRQTSASPVCSFSIASSRKSKGETFTDWVRCSLWGRRGQVLCDYLTKGSKVVAFGKLSTREYEGKTYLELEVLEIELTGRGQRGNRSQQEDGQKEQQGSSQEQGYGDPDDDIPF